MQDRNIPPQDWLEVKIKQHDENTEGQLELPLTDDGKEYTIDMLHIDQLHIFLRVMEKLQEWMESEDLSKFQPLRMTINGQGGSGKSVVINTIITYIRKMYGCNNVVKVIAPTGTSAYNVGGETFHHLLKMNADNQEYAANTLTKEKRLALIRKFKTFLALIIDERSLASFNDIGTAEQMVSETIFDGGPLRNHMSWGGLPILLLVGDDYQLPACGEGCIHALDNKFRRKMAHKGRQTVLDCAKNVMELKRSKRLLKSQTKDAQILQRIRTGCNIEDDDVQRLMGLHIDNMVKKNGRSWLDTIEEEAVYLFYKNEKRIRRNLEMIAKKASSTNPVAHLHVHSESSQAPRAISNHFSKEAPYASFLCIGAKVALEKKNIYPMWGLHNGACGTVQEIVFKEKHNPNLGDLPLYVIVDFPLYRGPVWDRDNPTHVPIPVNTISCRYRCCRRQHIPLCLAYARTIHKFQGLTAGPTEAGKPRNMYQCIICDPDEKKYEGTALGLLYTALSRATTLGDENGNNSAIYFTGESFKPSRIYNLYKQKNSMDDFVIASKRKKWVAHLKRFTKKPYYSKEKVEDITRWAESTKYSYDALYTRMNMYTDIKSKSFTRKRKST